jgi:two-component system cell cycle sensor histidine kinase/response regulator CckA
MILGRKKTPDLSERECEELRRSRERLQLAFESSNAGLWDWDVPTGRAYFSPRFYTMLGYAPGDFPSGFESLKALFHPDDLGAVLSKIDDFLQGRREAYSFEFRMRTKEGQWRWVLSRGKAVEHDARGRVKRIVGTHTDISERRWMEEQLRESEKKFRSFIEQASEAIALCDERGVMIEFNPGAEELIGVRREPVIGTPIWEFHMLLVPEDRRTPENRRRIEALYREALAGGVSELFKRPLEGSLRRGKGGTRYFRHRLFPIRTDQGFRIGSITHDVTDEKQTAEALRTSEERFVQSQKMEAVGRLASGIAHDFNNLLTVIKGYCDVAGDKSCAESEIEGIKDAVKRASGLTSQLLAFGRKQAMEPKILALNSIVGNMETILRRVIGEDIELITALAKDSGTIKANSAQVEQIIMNLAVNARDAMPKGGRLTIETEGYVSGGENGSGQMEVEPGNYVRLSVSDTGHGMDAETRNRIFEPFFTTKERGKGTGLGLSTVYGIVGQCGGTITCRSEPGKGTTFGVYFPRVADGEEDPKEQEKDAVDDRGLETILLVEDEQTVRRLTRTILERKGYTVLEAVNGLEAVELLSRREIVVDLAIADVVMPQMGGPELARWIQHERPGVGILLTSGYADDVAMKDMKRMVGVHFIRKPFGARDLLALVREILDKNKVAANP